MYKVNVIYISYDGMTDPLGQSQVLPYLIGLSKLNYTFHLISFEKEERFLNKKHDIEKLISNTNIIWYPLQYHQQPPVFSTLYDLWNLKKMVTQITGKHNISMVHCRSYISSLIGLWLKREKGIPFLFDMRGFWADERVDGKIWNLKNPIFNTIYTYFKKKEKQFIVESDFIVSLTHEAKYEIQKWNLSPKNKKNIQVIPCCADFEHFSFDKVEAYNNSVLKQKLGFSDNDFVISYIGSLGTWYMIEEMMDFFKVTLKKIPSCKFLILTADNPSIAYEAAQVAGIDEHKIVVKKAERFEVPQLISLSKFSVFFIKPSYSKKASSPTKLAEILGMGVPVVCNANVGDVQSIVEDGKVGYVIHEFNTETYEKAIDKMQLFLPEDALRIAAYAHKYASLEDGVLKYASVYKQILNFKDGGTTRL